uniref:Uncharacterized protein n=1 Tax=Lepeophtheirus salmonis TaxID=72036 RepID=A0A0K2T703_LEPSM
MSRSFLKLELSRAKQDFQLGLPINRTNSSINIAILELLPFHSSIAIFWS